MCLFALIILILILLWCNLDLLIQGNFPLQLVFLSLQTLMGLCSFVYVLFLHGVSDFAWEIVLKKHFGDICNFETVQVKYDQRPHCVLLENILNGREYNHKLSYHHRIIEWLWLLKTLKNILFHLSCQGGTHFSRSGCSKVHPAWPWNTSSDPMIYVILVLMQIKYSFDHLEKIPKRVNGLCCSLKEMLMHVTWYQHKLEGQDLKPVSFGYLKFWIFSLEC